MVPHHLPYHHWTLLIAYHAGNALADIHGGEWVLLQSHPVYPPTLTTKVKASKGVVKPINQGLKVMTILTAKVMESMLPKVMESNHTAYPRLCKGHGQVLPSHQEGPQ